MTTKDGIDPLFTRQSLMRLGAHYLAGQDPRQPLLSPAVHADLTGLPPRPLQAGSNEVLLDDSTRLATRAAAAGVDVILDVTADVPHVFQSFTGSLDEADAALTGPVASCSTGWRPPQPRSDGRALGHLGRVRPTPLDGLLGQWAVVDDVLHDKGGGQALDPRQGGQPLVGSIRWKADRSAVATRRR